MNIWELRPDLDPEVVKVKSGDGRVGAEMLEAVGRERPSPNVLRRDKGASRQIFGETVVSDHELELVKVLKG